MANSGSGRLKPAATCVIIAAVLCLVVACSSKAPAASTPQQAAALFYQPLHQDANLNAAQWQQLLQLQEELTLGRGGRGGCRTTGISSSRGPVAGRRITVATLDDGHLGPGRERSGQGQQDQETGVLAHGFLQFLFA